MKVFYFIWAILLYGLSHGAILEALELPGWQLASFQRVDAVNPILVPCPDSLFYCPLQKKEVHWEKEHVFNPAAVVRRGKVYLIYRAEDDYGEGIGFHTSRLGIAESEDGLHFRKAKSPILFPTNDAEERNESPGGCEDPRIVETEKGDYIMTYTQWNRDIAVLAVASSQDLLHWEKKGYAFAKNARYGRKWSKSGSIVCRQEGDRLIAAKIQGKYWMYFGEGNISVATSQDLISWDPLLDKDNQPVIVLSPREGKFDSALVEPGPPAILTEQGIALLYNGKNALEGGDHKIPKGAYSAGQVLFDANDPIKILSRSKSCFLTPRRPYERKGQYTGGTVFIEGLVHFKGNWLLYYGAADSSIGVAISN